MYNFMKTILSGIKSYIDKIAGNFNEKVNEINEKIPTKNSQLENDTGYLTSETDPTVPDWAKQETKPSYTADEVGAATKKYVDDSFNTNNSAIESIQTSLENYYLKSEADTLHTEIEDYVDNQVAALVNAAPETLDTLGELAQAFEENKEVVEALDASITNKQDKVSDTLILVDTVTGIQHKIQIQNGQLVSFPIENRRAC